MFTEEMVHDLLQERSLSEVLGFETDEVARQGAGSSLLAYGGNSYIDFTGGIAVHACGHNHPEIVAAVRKQAEQVLHTSDIMRHTPQLELAHFLREKLNSIDSSDPWQFLFLNSGSESIDAAAKLALKATGRTKFIAFDGAFHGRTLFATALSCSKTLHWSAYEPFLEPLRQNILRAPAPPVKGCIAGVELLLNENLGEVAAIIFEPQMGEGGYFPWNQGAAQRLRELATLHGTLLIADEIQSGMGRTGKWFAVEHLGVAPDILVFGKAVGGGLPLAGVAAQRTLMEKWTPGEHGTTFGGNPVSCAAGVAALRIMEREGLVERAAQVGERVKSRLRTLVGRHGVVDVRGNGLMIGVELRDGAGNPDYARCEAVKLAARADGLLLLTCGAKIGDPAVDNAALRLIPALNTEEAILERGLSILVSAIEKLPVQMKAA